MTRICRHIIFIFVAIFSVFLLISCDGPGDRAYYRGNAEYLNGHYNAAFAHYLYAAHEGVVPAQYAVGYQYYYGQGTKRDESEGITWFMRAAPHSLRARYALHLIKENKPAQPWVLQLNKNGYHKTKIHSSKACVISVKCK
ncbi:MAG: hypothetical protein ACD_42C00396G0009 [uncultured bacterium]|nr:MAG: hypothetical protein ACD_42C00396G0009 [uncultured bacterium]OGT33361.1 MAG: hypothetical protein A3C44_04015 [Gammaproteobacteria bacterium RIFCSPHIGHO2_02_FULL_39_13]OGT50303.1 MAG: hypothetical protein A3E53_00940 [Gammaproteobacteria bacterium RIFCSPHIGHO2_12_FULL_39_24]